MWEPSTSFRPLCSLSVHLSVHRSSANVFRDLDDRSLTKEEEDIIAARVAAQRKLLEEREKRERVRQVRANPPLAALC